MHCPSMTFTLDICQVMISHISKGEKVPTTHPPDQSSGHCHWSISPKKLCLMFVMQTGSKVQMGHPKISLLQMLWSLFHRMLQSLLLHCCRVSDEIMNMLRELEHRSTSWLMDVVGWPGVPWWDWISFWIWGFSWGEFCRLQCTVIQGWVSMHHFWACYDHCPPCSHPTFLFL